MCVIITVNNCRILYTNQRPRRCIVVVIIIIIIIIIMREYASVWGELKYIFSMQCQNFIVIRCKYWLEHVHNKEINLLSHENENESINKMTIAHSCQQQKYGWVIKKY
jgi:hypothetical protein